MTTWICDGCGLEHPDSAEPPAGGCVLDRGDVGIEERGDLGPHGRWVTPEQLAARPHHVRYRGHGRGLHSLSREPRFAIGHWSFLARTAHGNLLWDPPAYLDDEIGGLVQALGGVAVVAASHPHMFGAQVRWSHAFDRAPVLVNAENREWLPRTDPVVDFWRGEARPLPGVGLVQLGGHMPGSAVAHLADGTLLVGDSISGVPKHPAWVSFTRSYPKLMPLSPAVVRRLVDRLDALDYDRLYTLGGDTLDADARQVVHRSADAHIRWALGEFDHLT
jgi:hypothetical protein